MTGENQLTVPERVPSLISTNDKPNREIFRDCQQFYLDCQAQQMPSVLACTSCLSKMQLCMPPQDDENRFFDHTSGPRAPQLNPLESYVPLRCRAGPQKGCFQEASQFLNKFKEKLALSANNYYESRSQGRPDHDLERNFRELKQIDFKL